MPSLTDRILDRFMRQAWPFRAAAAIRNQDALARIVRLAEAGPEDTVLDVAYGPGLHFYNRWIDASGVHALSEEAHAEGGRRTAKHGYTRS